MTEEMNQAEAPVSDAPSPSEPVTSEPTSDAQMEAEMAQAFDKANPEESGEWRRPPEWKPGPSESEPADLEAQEQVQQTSAIQPPVSLNKEAREHWASLPESVKQYIAQRETQTQQKISELGEYAKTAKELGQVFQEFADHLPKTEDGQTIPERDTVRLLLAAHRALEENPEAALRWLAESKGLSLNSLGEADVEQMRQQAYTEAQQQWQRQQQWEQQKRAHDEALQLQQYVERYAASKPHWAELEAEIQHHVAGLRGTNPHMDSREVLDIAYRRAVAANPQYDSEKKAEAKRAADAAKKAASLNVKSGGSSVFMKAAKGDVYAGMYEIYDRMNGGGRT